MDTDEEALERSVQVPSDFAVLFERHHERLHRFLARRLGGDAADDLTAEVFTRAFRRRDSFDAELGSAVGWLYGFAHRVMAEHRRAEIRQLRRNETAPMVYAPAPDDYERFDDAAQAADEYRRVLRGLAKLGPEHRDVVLLVAWEGLDYRETAQALNVPIGTVRSRLSRARASLAKLAESSETQTLESVELRTSEPVAVSRQVLADHRDRTPDGEEHDRR